MRAQIVLTTALASLAFAACTATAQAPEFAAAEPSASQAAPLDVRHMMQNAVNPAIVAIWDVGNNAANDDGGLDGALMTDASWASLTEAASDLAAAGETMSVAANLRAASPGNMATEEYEVSMDTVQRLLDADPQGFRDMASAFAQLSRSLEAAAQARNVSAAGEIVARMDTECAACHERFWYAEAAAE